MREIKFRAWNTKLNNGFTYIELWNPAKANIATTPNLERGHQEDYTLMQYTGLKDKNGKEIYEGDILGHFNGAVLGEVTFEEGSSQLSIAWTLGSWCYLEVIGNIYENPELLN